MLGSKAIAGALRRTASWLAPQTTPAYEGATQGRRLGRWQATPDGINQILFGSADVLRARSRDMVRKNPWAQQGVKRYTANAIGTGIKPQSLHPDEQARKQIHKLWRRWAKESDAHGVTNFYGQQAIVCRGLMEAGEVFVRFRTRRPEDGLTVPLQLQLIEAEHVPLNLNMTVGNGNVVRAGIEFDRIGNRVAYHMYREHPGDTTLLGNPNQLVRVPAEEVLHVFEALRPGQIRGVPAMAGVLLRLYEFDQYEDAELVRNRDAAMFSGFIHDDPQYLAALADDAAPDKMMPSTAGKDSATGDGVELLALEPGTFQKLKPGEDVKFSQPPSQAQGYDSFLKWNLRGIAAGMGVTMEQISGDLSGVNYSSLRAGSLEFRRAVEQFQYACFIQQFCEPSYPRWLDTAVLSGALPISASEYRRNRADWIDVDWIPQGWDWVDPEKEVKAAIAAIRSGLSSRSKEVSARGYDAEAIDAENAADNRRADDLDVAYDSDGRRPASGSNAATATAAEPDTAEPGTGKQENAA